MAGNIESADSKRASAECIILQTGVSVYAPFVFALSIKTETVICNSLHVQVALRTDFEIHPYMLPCVMQLTYLNGILIPVFFLLTNYEYIVAIKSPK